MRRVIQKVLFILSLFLDKFKRKEKQFGIYE